jgi:hypothetical protein
MAQWPKDGDAAPGQNLDATLFGRFPKTQNEFGPQTSRIGSYMKLTFQPYVERRKRTPFVAWASVLPKTTPGPRVGLELEL